MKSDVDFTPGLRRSSCLTVSPKRAAIVPNVSPALTTAYCARPPGGFGRGLFDLAAGRVSPAGELEPSFNAERTSRIAIVTPSRNAAGAARLAQCPLRLATLPTSPR